MKLALAGDVMLGRLVDAALEHRPADYPWGDTLPRFLMADWRACNLECVVSDRRPAVLPAKAFHFRSAARNVAVLEAAHIDAVSIANNHVLDFGPAALLDMLDILDRAGIARAGAGRDLEEARRPAITMAADGSRIGLVACTDNEPDWEAGNRRPGVFHIETDLADKGALALLGITRDTRPEVDLLVVSLHWGPNWGYRPPRSHCPLARAQSKRRGPRPSGVSASRSTGSVSSTAPGTSSTTTPWTRSSATTSPSSSPSTWREGG